MKYFVTGASGFIGSKVVEFLVAEGHQVTGLVRSDEGAAKVKALGAEAVRGDLSDPDPIVEAAKKADGTLHLGFIHDINAYDKSLVVDKELITKVNDAYVGTNKVFVSTSGTLYLVGEEKSDEDSPVVDSLFFSKRAENEALALSYASKGVRSVSVRLTPTVHDVGDKGFIPLIQNLLEQKGAVYYQGDGLNKWAAVHRRDAARLFVLAAEKAPAGSILHAVGEEGVPFKDIAGAIAKKYNLKLESVEDLKVPFGPFIGTIGAVNNHTSSEKTKKLVGWEPQEVGLVDDILNNY